MRNVFFLTILMFFSLVSLPAETLPALDRGVENAIHPMLLIDERDNSIRYANPACAEYFSIPKERLIGRNFPALIGKTIHSLTELHGQMISLETNEERELYFLIGIQQVGATGSPYFMVLLQDKSAEQRLIVRNRHISYALVATSLLTILFLTLFLVFQSRQNRQLQKENQQHEDNLSLLKQFLNADNRYSYIKDSEGRFLTVNDNLCSLLACEEASLLGKQIEEVAHHDLATLMVESDQETLNELKTMEKETPWRERLYKTTKFPLLLPGGTLGVGTFAEDITEQRHLERTLRENVQRTAAFSHLLSSSIKNPDNQLTHALEEVCAISGSKIGVLLIIDEKTRTITMGAAKEDKPLYDLPQRQGMVIPSSVTDCYLTEKSDASFSIINEQVDEEPILSYITGEKLTVMNLLVCTCMTGTTLSGILLLANSKEGYNETEGFQIQLLFSGIWANMHKAQNAAALEASKRDLRLILDSTAEGIFGTDGKGRCTFCNASCLRLLGYEDEQELLGKNMHQLIHHSTKEGLPIDEETCPIRSCLSHSDGVAMENEVFWRKDGTCLDILCYAYPKVEDGTIIGSVITFLDNTERKKNQEKIAFLSLHDQLTGLHNRTYADQAMARLDTEDQLPLSIIIGDVNGLKLTNDIFGHAMGDKLLQSIARSLRLSCRTSDVVSRIGGDEFLILLPHTDGNEADQIAKRIEEHLEEDGIRAGKRSIALGSATKTSTEETIQGTFDRAEDQMYRRKTLRRAETHKKQLQDLREMLYAKAPGERLHATKVQQHAAHLATLLHLNDEEVSKLKRAGLYHDIGKVILAPEIITSKNRTILVQERYREHVSAGYRILNMFEETVDLAPMILHHHEWWDGSGYMKGLRGTEIPYFSRLLRLAEVWEREHLDKATNEQIEKTLTKLAGIEVDPHLVERILSAL
ncbi:diguanylate cyclase [uncultured Sphaerochaeta sp.]|uniref:diguanylate cyclase n=1 Tax=uncultured Sphaerochaeta sp. TaxID=886478 RepID=UPI002AA8B4CB|nr:diguanylate cyclase [uncultured Sphaerochaeta sp.]